MIEHIINSEPIMELALIFFSVVVGMFIMQLFKLPQILGMIFAGVVLGPMGVDILHFKEGWNLLSEIGVLLLLFIVGLGLNVGIIQEMGKRVFYIGTFQILLSRLIGTLCGILFGLAIIDSIFIGIAISLSSTIIVIKSLADNHELESIHGKTVIGVLIMQDIFALLILLFSSTISQGGSQIVVTLLYTCIVGVALYAFYRYLLKRIIAQISYSTEFLLIFAGTLCFTLAFLFEIIGLSLEMGALIGGVMLASTPYRFQVMSSLKSLRDFFIVLFFVNIGSGLLFPESMHQWLFVGFIIVIVLVIKPFLVTFLMGKCKFNAKSSLLSGIYISQISEFSFIMLALVAGSGLLKDSSLVSLFGFGGTLSIVISTIAIQHKTKIRKILEGIFTKFFGKHNLMKEIQNESYEAIVIGYNRTGPHIVETLKKIGKKAIVVDMNPDVIERCEKEGISAMYGDINALTLLEEFDWKHTEIAVSTISDLVSQLSFLQFVKKVNRKCLVICTASSEKDVSELYHQGANYVILPQTLSAKHIGNLLENYENIELSFNEQRDFHQQFWK